MAESSDNLIITQIAQKDTQGNFVYNTPVPIGGKAQNIYCYITKGEEAGWISLQEMMENYNSFLENGIFPIATSDNDFTPSDTEHNLLWIDYSAIQNPAPSSSL
jgi:hypothetical protein